MVEVGRDLDEIGLDLLDAGRADFVDVGLDLEDSGLDLDVVAVFAFALLVDFPDAVLDLDTDLPEPTRLVDLGASIYPCQIAS